VSAQVLFSRHNGVGLVTLNRPEKLNAFADRMRDELGKVMRDVAVDAAIRAVVITGAGRAFCAGADIARMHDLIAGEDWDTLEVLVEAGAAVVRTIDGLAKPVLAAVNGVAAGGRANLALACDIRVRGAYALTLPQALDVERAHQLRLFKTPEAREAMRAFLAKRPPAEGVSA
jgi:2-(1,2-epoxy-1,2-dihydrophenyl)acetyl-CoA isomerase